MSSSGGVYWKLRWVGSLGDLFRPLGVSRLADNNSFEQWEADGSQDAVKRANTLWKQQLQRYEAPPLDPAIDEALTEFMTRRKSESPDMDY